MNKKDQKQKVEEQSSASEQSKKTDKTEHSGHHTPKKTDKSAGKIKELESKIIDLQDKYLRVSAEFDNYRKRTLREKIDLLQNANEELIRNILPVIDDFERGLTTIDNSKDIEALKQGIHLIYNKISDFLKQNSVKEIDALNQVFNIDFHEAVTKTPAPSDDLKGKVIDVIEKGYLLNDKVIRYSKVVVGE